MLDRISRTTDIPIEPKTAQLTLSSRRPKVKVSNHERDAKLNREAVARHRERTSGPNRKNPKSCTIVEYDRIMLDALVRRRHLLDIETGDPKKVGKAISAMVSEAARSGK